jgi:hypothetical protein
MDAAEPRRLMETAEPRASRAAKRAFTRRPGHERDAAIAACVPKVRATRVFNLGMDKGSVARAGPNIRRAILRVIASPLRMRPQRDSAAGAESHFTLSQNRK